MEKVGKVWAIPVLLVDKEQLEQFLYSCAATEVLAEDSTIVREPTGLLWGLGNRLPGGTASRVTSRGGLSTNGRKALAVDLYARLLSQFRERMADPKGQVAFLGVLEARRQGQRVGVQALFAQAEGANASTDATLRSCASFANGVQSVACIALVTLGTGGSMTGAVVAGQAFACVLGTKAIIAGAQSEHDLTSLAGFAIGTLKDGACTLGELSSKAFELVKDFAIDESRGRMGLATANYLQELASTTRKIAELQARLLKDQATLWTVKPGSGIAGAIEKSMVETNAEIAKLRAAGELAGKGAVGASKTGQFMKNFGGKFVPLVCLTIDVISEYQRYQEVDAELQKGGFSAPSKGRGGH